MGEHSCQITELSLKQNEEFKNGLVIVSDTQRRKQTMFYLLLNIVFFRKTWYA